MSIEQSGNPGADKLDTNSVEHAHTEEERVEHEADKMAKKAEHTLKNSDSNNLFTK
ncbi:hypothetical protein [Granulicella sp. WH15]|uniref:hypothetical protein n=1 Tax=Granulicella sp. WH15 TaxID=2602070 RepID=UPI0013A58633|nr:hypothetical protein [Granulicella sp. WH15]